MMTSTLKLEPALNLILKFNKKFNNIKKNKN